MYQGKTGSEKCLIVNADDFGESTRVSEGILKAHREGVVTSVSLLSNMEGFGHAVASLAQAPGFDVGVHLNMHRGAALTTAPYLAPKGTFLHSPSRFMFRCFLNPRRAREEITREFEAQIEKVRMAGVTISHLDTEKHLHTLPLVFGVVLALATKYKIPSVRLPYELPTARTLKNPSQFVKLLVMALFAPYNRYLLKKSGVTAPDRLIGVSLSRQFTVEKLAEVLENLPSGTTELSCHPGLAPETFENYIDAHREEELRALTDPKLRKLITESGIVLSTFSDIR